MKAVLHHLVENRWPFRLRATYNETITRALNVYEEVNRQIPFDRLHCFFDHCETISDKNMNASRRSKEELPSKTGWLFKVNILSVVTGPSRRSARLQLECWRWVCRLGPGRMPLESRVQPIPFSLLAGHREDDRWFEFISGGKPIRSCEGAG